MEIRFIGFHSTPTECYLADRYFIDSNESAPGIAVALKQFTARVLGKPIALFEVVINAIRKSAPGAAIAFNTLPDDSAARWVGAGSRSV